MSDIPKFISTAPWYNQGDDATAHHRKNPDTAADYSVAAPGSGMQHGWDAKRDRWNGYVDDQWLASARTWVHADDSDSDGTTYELELHELGLQPKDIKVTVKEDKHEKVIRDRSDVPQYIMRIGAVEPVQWTQERGANN